MQFVDFDNIHSHQPQEISLHPFDAALPYLHWVGKLFRSPLAIVLLVWGFLFIVLGVALAYGQEAGCAAGAHRKVSGKKTEAVEIFSVGEVLVTPPKAVEKKDSPRRRAIAGRRARR